MEQGWLQFFAPLYGAGVVIFYAYRRFNEASYSTMMGLERLNSLLSVSRMRATSVVRLSFLYYAGALLTIYLLVSAYVLLFSVTLEEDPAIIGGVAPSAVRSAMGESSIVFLSVALAVVGLGPNIPYLRNVEEWLRRSAHGLAGIPTRVLAHMRELQDQDFFLETENLELLRPEDRILLENLRARNDLPLLRDVTLIVAVSAWILNSRNLVGESPLHDTFSKLEENLRSRKRDLLQRLIDELGLSRRNQAKPTPALGDQPLTVRAEADELADDICVLLALYDEHGLLRLPIKSSDHNTAQYSANTRRHLLLRGFIQPSDGRADLLEAEQAMFAIAWTFGVVVVFALIWSAVPGMWEQQIRYWGEPDQANIGWGRRLIETLTDGLFTFFLPVAVGVGIWQGAKASGSWGQGLSGHWTQALSRALLIFGFSWAVGTFFICGAALFLAALKVDWQRNWHEILGPVFTFNAPYVIRGAVLAMLVVGCLDRCQQERPRTATIWWTSLLAAFFLGLIGCMVRLQGVLSVSASEGEWPSAYRAGVVFYATVYAALIGFCLIFALTSALRNMMREDLDPRHRSADRFRHRHRLVRFPLHDLRKRLLKDHRLLRFKLRRLSGKERRPAANGSGMGTLILAAVLLCALPAGSVAQQITIGVRDDARPYVWVERDAAGNDRAKGYFWEICALVVANAGLTFKFERINLDVRQQIMTGQHKEVDLLCDPTTVTLRRLTEFIGDRPPGPDPATHLRVSPIFHLANRGYLMRTLSPPGDQSKPTSWWNRCISDPLKRWQKAEDDAETPKDGTTPCLSLRPLKDEAIPTSNPLRIAVRGTTSADALGALPACKTGTDLALESCLVSSHQDAAVLFCTATRSLEYHGDIELIRAAVGYWNEAHPGQDRCIFNEGKERRTNQLDAPVNPDQVEKLADTYQNTYEPYAFLISNHNVSDLDLRLTLELYRLAREGRLRSMLESHFHETTISTDLDSLFRILSIPPGAQRRTDDRPSTRGASAVTASDKVAK